MMTFGGTFEEEFDFTKTREEIEMLDFNEIKDYTPEEVHDENEFKPIKGAYECRIDRFERVKGVSEKSGEPYDFYSLSLEVIDAKEGDKGLGRYLKRTYQADNEGVKKMLNDMFTSGIELDRSSEEALDMSLGSAKDKIVKVRTWVWTPEKERNGTPIPEENRKGKQQIKIIKEFKLGKGGKDKEELPSEKVPF